MASEKYYVLEFNQHIKSNKMLFIIYADIEFLMKKETDVKINERNLQQQD